MTGKKAMLRNNSCGISIKEKEREKMKNYFSKLFTSVLVITSILFLNVGTARVFGAMTLTENSNVRSVSAAKSPAGLKNYNIQMSLRAQKTGLVGDKIDILSFSHSIISPRDPQSGLPTGRRMHKPLMISKQVDKTSPIIMNILCTNENISELVLTFTDSNPRDSYTIRLTNANIASIDMSEDDSGSLIEEIGLTYQKIEWTWKDGGITSSDYWEASN